MKVSAVFSLYSIVQLQGMHGDYMYTYKLIAAGSLSITHYNKATLTRSDI